MIPDLTPYTEELAPICDHVSPSLLDCRKIILDSQGKIINRKESACQCFSA